MKIYTFDEILVATQSVGTRAVFAGARASAIALAMLFAPVGARAADGPPRVVAAWAAGPLEARVAFDRAVDPAIAPALVGTRIVFGDDVKPGERYIARNPGDPPPGGPKAETRGSLRIAAARLVDEGRTLVLATDPHSRDSTYALNLPAPLAADLVYNLRGAEVSWDNGKADAAPEWLGWWPSVSLAEAKQKLAGSAGFEALQARLGTPGRLTLKSMLPLPKGKATIVVKASVPVEVGLSIESAMSKEGPAGIHVAEVAAEVESDVTDLTVTLTLDGKTSLSIAATDLSGQPLDPGKLTLPWAPLSPPNPAPVPVPSQLLSGGDVTKGAIIFKGEQAKCATCHKMRGEGGEVGPDLSNLAHRDRAWVYQNIAEPSAPIHPDYVPYTVLTKDGRVLAGIVRAEGSDAIKVLDTEAKATVVAKADIEELKPSATSIMPVGLLGAVGEAGVKDLLAYLTGK